LRDLIDLANIAMLFLLGVVFIAYRFGRGPAVLAALLSVASFDFFFVPPRLSFAVSDVEYVLTFAVMLTVALVIGSLTAGLRYQARVAHYREERARNLYEMAKSLSSSLVDEQVVEISDRFVESSFRAKAAILLPDAADKLQAPLACGAMPAYDLAVAQWCYDRNAPAGVGTDTLPANPQLYLPLRAPMRVRGVLVVEPSRTRLLLIPEQRRLLDTFAALVAIALERIHFVSVAQDTLIKMESERLRNTLLAGLSHDLRTPLTALVGLAETLYLDLAAAQSQHADRAGVLREQALRTSRMVNNLLEMARLQSGDVKPHKDWQSIEEMAGGALQALDSALANRPVKLDLPADLPLVRCDAVLIERVLVNLIENAIKYTPEGTAIGVSAARADGSMRIEVWDEGPGLPAGQERALFARFARGQKESAVPGVGLGLAICEAIVAAHGGRIWAENRAPHGARFVFTLPLEEQPIIEREAAS
jgi:two-component system sensor histidine kinase KdpD